MPVSDPIGPTRGRQRTAPRVTWFQGESAQPTRFLAQGREAEIWLSQGPGGAAVLKRWNGAERVSASRQLELLRRLSSERLPVPAPYGWGLDQEGHEVLAMAYAGDRLPPPRPSVMPRLARLLSDIHRASYGWGARPGVHHLTRHLGQLAVFPDLCALAAGRLEGYRGRGGLVHGDFHPGNIVIRGNSLVVVDWSAAGRGDVIYDLAWATLLLRIYYGEPHAAAFLRSYQAGSEVPEDDFQRATLAASLRWLYLARTAPVPIDPAHLEIAAEVAREAPGRE